MSRISTAWGWIAGPFKRAAAQREERRQEIARKEARERRLMVEKFVADAHAAIIRQRSARGLPEPRDAPPMPPVPEPREEDFPQTHPMWESRRLRDAWIDPRDCRRESYGGTDD